MECSLTRLITLISGAIIFLFTAIGLLSSAIAPAALFLIAAAYALLPLVKRTFDQYRACRDAAEGPSACPTDSISNHFAALSILLGIATTATLAIILTGWIPAIGQVLGGASAATGVAAMAMAVAILLSLIVFLVMYRNCRNDETQAINPNAIARNNIVGENSAVGRIQD